MNIESLDGGVAISLSRSNLNALILRLDGGDPDDPAFLYRVTERGVLWVQAEEDEAHYQGRRTPTD